VNRAATEVRICLLAKGRARWICTDRNTPTIGRTGPLNAASSAAPSSLSCVRFHEFANNPGDWMLHCHVTDHEVSGMMTVLRVA